MPSRFRNPRAFRASRLLGTTALVAGVLAGGGAAAEIPTSSCPSGISATCYSGDYSNDQIVIDSISGTGEAGGTINVYSSANINVGGVANSVMIQLISTGGDGSSEVGEDGAGGNGAPAGDVTLDNEGELQWDGDASSGPIYGIYTQSLGGSAVEPDEHGDGGLGGDAGVIEVTNDAPIQMSGSFANGVVGITALAKGGAGGAANDASINHHGGNGGSGGSVNLTNNAPIELGYEGEEIGGSGSAHAIEAQSVGGNGGANGYSNGGGEHSGNGGGAATVVVENYGDLSVDWINNNDGSTDSTIGIWAQSVGGNGSNSAHNYESGGLGGSGSNVTVQNYADITVSSSIDSLSSGAGIWALSQGGSGGVGQKQGDSATDGQGGQGGDAANIWIYNNETAFISTSGANLHGIQAEARGGAGGSGASGYSEDNSSGGDGGEGGAITIGITGSSIVSTTGDNAYGVLAQGIGGYGGDGGNDGGLVGESGGAGEGGEGGSIEITTDSGTAVGTSGDYAPGIAAQSIGGGGGTGGDFIGVLGGQGGDGGRGGNAASADITHNGEVTTSGDHSYGLLVQSIAGGGGAGGVATGLIYALGGDGGAGGTGESASATVNGKVETLGYGAHGLLVQSIGGGGGAAGMAAGGISVGGDGGAAYTSDGGAVTITLNGSIDTTGDAANGVLAQSVGGGGGSGAGSTGVISVGGNGEAGGAGGVVTFTVGDASVTTAGDYAHALVAQSLGGGGGNGGDVLDFSIGVPTVGVGGTAAGGGAGGAVSLDYAGYISTAGDHSYGILAQSVGGGGGNGGDATGLGGLSIVDLTIGGGGGGGGGGGSVTLTGEPDNAGIVTAGAYSIGALAQSVGGGGGNGGNANGYDASFNFAVSVAVGGHGGDGGGGGEVTVNWQGGSITTGADLAALAAPDQPIPITGQATNAYGLVAQSVGGGGGNGGSASVDQLTFSIPDGDVPLPTVNLTSAVGGKGGLGGNGGAVEVAFDVSTITTWGAGSHGLVAQSVGGGGGSGGDATALGISAAIPKTTALPAINLSFSLGGSGGVPGNGGSVEVTLGATGETQVLTYGDNANAVVAQSIGGGGGDAGVGSASTFTPGEASSFSFGLGLGGSGSSGGSGEAVSVTLGALTLLQTVGSGARGLVAQSIGGGGGTSQGGTAALYAGPFVGTVQVGRTGGSGGDGGTVTVENAGQIVTLGGDADGILAQSIGGGGGLGGSFGADGSLDDPNWVDVVLDIKHEIGEITEGSVTYSLTATIGGKGGTGGGADTVTITNSGTIQTLGDWADGIVAQSIGGGGGSGGTAVADGSQQTASVTVGVGGSGGGGGDGGEVTVDQVGSISTAGYSAYGLLAQSIGGGGGQGGDGSNKATGSITVGSGVGGSGGTAGNGDTVEILGGGTVATLGDDAHAIVAQSIGGGGGTGGAGNSQSAAFFENIAFDIVVGGAGGASGAGGTVTIELAESDFFTVTTAGERAFGLVAQSIGGGGGIGGAGTAASIVSVAVGGNAGSGNVNGGAVSIDINASSFSTAGQGAHAIVAQSIGGGGGIGGDASGAPLSFSGNTEGNYGDGGAVTISTAGTILTTGDAAFGILAQSIGGGGGFGGSQAGAFAGSNGNLDSSATSGPVTITLGGTLTTSGEESIGIFAQSDSGQTNGTITITVNGVVSGGSGTQGAGVHVDEGNDSNSLTINAGGSVTALSGNAIVYSGGATLNTLASDSLAPLATAGAKLDVFNHGLIRGSVLLRSDADLLGLLASDGTILAGPLLDAEVTNGGLLLIGLQAGGLETTRVGGSYSQLAEGTLALDADLGSDAADLLAIDGQATLDGAATFNFLSLLPGGSAKVLEAEGGIAGALEIQDSGIFDLALSQQGNALHLAVGGADFRSQATNGSQQAVAGHLQSIWDAGGSAALAGTFGALENIAVAGGYGDALQDLSPGVALAPAARTRSALQFFTGSLMSCPAFEGDDALLGETSCGWVKVAGRVTRQSDDDGVAGFDNSRVSYQAGGQLELAPEWFLGGSVAYEQAWFTGDDGRVTSEGDGVFLGVSVKRVAGPWTFGASLGGGWGWYDTERVIPAFDEVADSDPQVRSVGGRLRAAYSLAAADWYLKPILDLELLYVRSPAYAESGAGALDLEYDETSQFTFAFSPSLEVGGRMPLSDGLTLRPYAQAGVSVLTNDEWEVETWLAGAPPGSEGFDTRLPLDQVIGRVSAGVQLLSAAGFDLRVNYDGEFSSHITSHGGALVGSIRF